METFTHSSTPEKTSPTPEAAPGETTFDSLASEVPFNAPQPEPTPETPPTPDKDATLSALHQQIKATYQHPTTDLPPTSDLAPELPEEDTGIIPKERSKFDLVGKARDRADLRTITNLIYDSADHPENQPDNLKKAEALLNPYIANSVIDACLDTLGTTYSDNDAPFRLLNNFSADTLSQKFRDSHKSAEIIIEKSHLTGKFQNVVTDALAEQFAEDGGFDYEEPLISDKVKHLSDQNHEKLFTALRNAGNLNTAVQFLTPTVGQKYHDQLASELTTPFQLAHAIQKGDLTDIAPPDFTDTVKLALNNNSSEALQLYNCLARRCHHPRPRARQ